MGRRSGRVLRWARLRLGAKPEVETILSHSELHGGKNTTTSYISVLIGAIMLLLRSISTSPLINPLCGDPAIDVNPTSAMHISSL